MADLVVSDKFKGKAVSRDRSVEKPRHQERTGEAGVKSDAVFPLEYRFTCEKENFTASPDDRWEGSDASALVALFRAQGIAAVRQREVMEDLIIRQGSRYHLPSAISLNQLVKYSLELPRCLMQEAFGAGGGQWVPVRAA